jgi:hypothetical protein
MTVLGGTRPLPGALPRGATPRAAARPVAGSQRRRVSRRTRAARRSSPVRPLIGVVLVSFLLGLLYLAHTVDLAATQYRTDQLIDQRDDLARQVQTIETSVLRWGAEPTVVERAQQLGLDQLSTRVRLSAR